MTRTDDNHRVAEIIKGLEERIADLEEKDRGTVTPNLLRSHTDRVVVDDSQITVKEQNLESLTWNDAQTGGETTGGYGEGGYGEGGYGETETLTGPYGTAPYGTRPSGGSVFAEVANSGWQTGTWGSY